MPREDAIRVGWRERIEIGFEGWGRFVDRLRMEGMNEEDSVALALRHSGFAVLMTSVTRAVGMASFLTAELASIADLGLLAPFWQMCLRRQRCLLWSSELADLSGDGQGPHE